MGFFKPAAAETQPQIDAVQHNVEPVAEQEVAATDSPSNPTQTAIEVPVSAAPVAVQVSEPVQKSNVKVGEVVGKVGVANPDELEGAPDRTSTAEIVYESLQGRFPVPSPM